MRKLQINTIKGLAFSASALALVSGSQAFAQDADCPEGTDEVDGECVVQSDGPDGVDNNDANTGDVVDVTSTGASGERSEGAIVVTGSRIRRDTYSSISPLQVLTTESEQEAGLFDPTSILQRSESAAGVQIDATFQGFVLDNGPGSTTLDLRGLGADRTLLLINGRRLAPAGVEGAPTAPSLNLLPSTLIDRYDLLLDGASSVYGSDAVAGVGNVILRKDFDGLELTAFGNINPEGGGDDYTVGAAWGFNTDRGFFGIGAEYDYRDTIRLRDRDFFRGCTTNLDITNTGEVRRLTIDQQANALADSNGTVTTSTSECIQDGFNNRIIIPFTNVGSVYRDNNTYFGGQTGNSGIPGYSESFFGGPVDADGDGVRDIDFLNDYNLNGANPDQTFLSEQKRYNILAYGEYTFPGEANITPFFEAMYTRAEIRGDNEFFAQIFPYVPDNNAFNPCNTNVTGVDCRSDTEGSLPGSGLTGFGPISVRPVFAIEGDRNNTDVTQEQYRGVFGIRGDLPFIAPSWSFEVSGVYSYADGKSNVRGIREDKLAFALGIDPTMDFDGDGVVDNNGDGIADDYISGATVGNSFIAQVTGGLPAIDPCDASALANPGLAMPDLLDGCVAVNLFADSVLGSAQGDFATQAERDYVFGDRSFDTTYEQIVVNAFVTGDLFTLPAGPVGGVFGVEYRRDEINSVASDVASNGLFFGFFADSGATGSKEIKEAFGEIDIPLQAGKPWVQELNLNLSGRITDEEFYGTNYTYSIKAGWRPIESLLLKFSYGTSFRAPNLRENFLGSQSGFNSVTDPCAVPDAAFDVATGTYDPTNETRDQRILDNCIREGRDPTTVGLQIDPTTGQSLSPIQIASVEVTRGGALDIDPETSRSLTAGFAFEETFGDGWDFALSTNYYDIKVKDSIIAPSVGFIVSDCYTREDPQRSAFCDRITASTTGSQLISDVFAGFINLNEESVRGLDFNSRLSKEVQAFGTIVDLGLNVRANHLIERSTLFIDDTTGNFISDRDEGEVGLQEWTGRATFTADIDKWRFTWNTRYIGGFDQDPDNIDPFSDVFGYDADGNFIGQTGSTCLGGGSRDANGVPDGVVVGDGVYCRPIGYAEEQFLHTASIRYRADTWDLLVGVSNVFDTAPPQVSPFASGITDISNTALGAGYDYNGREFFARFNIQF
ncbi:TonB-dependent receptor [Qipengyuania sp. 1NDW9]|uniref:TonB-dependent receptor domain-containing protein n=1 Tax=Qipengyuania xiapuensis TaxID=2867236 RepID=UPI001C88A902|nr:TonB-dependent receptor [Qipengyuania xiapuensis]MBX7493781.1 TonB-dependent receptor [Qipengyuania xiapuensis]